MVLLVAMAIHVLVIYGNGVYTQLVKSVIDKLKYQLVLPPVMLMVAMAMEGEPSDIECKLHLINVGMLFQKYTSICGGFMKGL